jgi:hypothetical protein
MMGATSELRHAPQTAARYGSTAVPLSNLKLAVGQPALTGLGTLAELEILNEPDGTWNGGRNGYYCPFEYAAALSAAYDGHCGALGPTAGAKTADPGIRVVAGGLAAGFDILEDYWEAMRQWSVARRPCGTFPADVLNFHHYTNDGVSAGISPEAANLTTSLFHLCGWRDVWAPTIPIWLSEFGYDVDPRSPQVRARARACVFASVHPARVAVE